jgi:glutathione S-transferase
MSASATDLILHQYDLSPFSEKGRLMMGFKGLPWHACIHSTIMPKPELVALTGGYRQIPVLQIGADIYCSTELIAEELERRFPEPPLFVAGGPGISIGLGHWIEEILFWLIVEITCASDFASLEDPAFIVDRKEMLGDMFDVDRMKADLPRNLVKLRMHVELIDRQLRDGRTFLFGDQPGIADITVYHPLDFLSVCRNGVENFLDDYPVIRAWMGRVGAIGHGTRREISREDALAAARQGTPQSVAPIGPPLENGPPVRFVCWIPGSDVLEGQLVLHLPRRIAIRRETPALGETIVHLPRTAGTLLTEGGEPL